jgi:hypothetical protein
VDALPELVITGLDPVIHAFSAGGDGQIKSGHDG